MSEDVARLLRELLWKPDYLAIWQPLAERNQRMGELNQSAIAKVITGYLWDTGLRAETDRALARILKDRVHRALTGGPLSSETLTWIVEAFDMEERDRRVLWAARLGQPADGPVINSLIVNQRLPAPQHHRTLSSFERRVHGPTGLPHVHHATRAIKAVTNRVRSYPFWSPPSTDRIYITRGGTLAGEGDEVQEIVLNRPLEIGQIASIEYQIHFSAAGSPVSEYRRVAHARSSNLDLVVQFDPSRIPASLWWTIWDAPLDGRAVITEPVVLDADHCVHRFLPALQNAAAGFRWVW